MSGETKPPFATLGLDHVVLRVHLAAHGIEAGEPAPRYGADGTGPSLYIKDPDGNTVELKGPPQQTP